MTPLSPSSFQPVLTPTLTPGNHTTLEIEKAQIGRFARFFKFPSTTPFEQVVIPIEREGEIEEKIFNLFKRTIDKHGSTPLHGAFLFDEEQSEAYLAIEKSTSHYSDITLETLRIAAAHGVTPTTYFSETHLFQRYVSGKTLRQLIGWAPNPNLKSTIRIQIAIQLVDLFACLHEQQIGVRDLQPSNILIDSSQQSPIVYLHDLSHSCYKNSSCNGTYGSPRYSSLEMEKSEPYDPYLSDLFILGLNLYFLATGQELKQEIVRCPREDAEGLQDFIDNCIIRQFPDRELRPVLLGLLKVNPKERISFESALHLLENPPPPPTLHIDLEEAFEYSDSDE